MNDDHRKIYFIKEILREIARRNSNTIPSIKAADSYTVLKITYAQSCKK